MTDFALPGSIEPARKRGPDLDRGFHPLAGIVFLGVIAAALLFVAYSIYADVDATGAKVTTYLPYILLFVALLIALGLRVRQRLPRHRQRGRHGHLHPRAARAISRWCGRAASISSVFWSSSGAVAFGIVSLLPVELILQVGSGAGFAMVFALLIAAIAWNLGTWLLGLPASSSHTLIGSIIGVGIANALLHGRSGTSGVDWGKATEIGYALLLSPLFGFCLAAHPAAAC